MFEIRTQHLLTRSHVPRFLSGRASVIDDQIGFDTRLGCNPIAQSPAGIVGANYPDQDRLSTKAGYVPRDIASPPQHDLLVADADHGNGSFGGYATAVPVHECIQHHVADDKHAAIQTPG
jgi:hypothetical protein